MIVRPKQGVTSHAMVLFVARFWKEQLVVRLQLWYSNQLVDRFRAKEEVLCELIFSFTPVDRFLGSHLLSFHDCEMSVEEQHTHSVNFIAWFINPPEIFMQSSTMCEDYWEAHGVILAQKNQTGMFISFIAKRCTWCQLIRSLNSTILFPFNLLV